MSPVIDPIWLCSSPKDMRARVIADQLGLASILENEQLVVFGTAGAPIDLHGAAARLQSEGYVKYFENAYMPSILNVPARLELVQGYFDLVSSMYGALTRSGLNVACYEHLFKEATSRMSAARTCLDFGCGPGTILQSRVAAEVSKLVGWDFSPQMRHIARMQGLNVLDEADFFRGDGAFDVVLAAFVFHYGTVTDTLLSQICAHLSVGGVLVANFHKNLGLERFMSMVNQVPNLRLHSPNESSEFGTVSIVSRVR